MLKKILAVMGGLFLFVSWVTIQLPVVRDAHCVAALCAPYTQNNDLLVLSKCDEAVGWKKALIMSANRSIEFSAGYTAGALLEDTLLTFDAVLAAKPDLVVHFFICSCPLFSWADERKVEVMAERYPGRFHYLIRGMTPLRRGLGLVTSENHIKLLVVDDHYMVVGGTNHLSSHSRSEIPSDDTIESFADFFNPRACIDMNFVIKGPVVSNLRREFFDLWALYESGASLAEHSQFEPEETRCFAVDESSKHDMRDFEEHSDVIRNIPIKSIVCGPRRSPGACSAEYATLIDHAEHSIDLMHMHVTPVDEVYSSLLDASNRGVALTVVTNGPSAPASMVSKVYGVCNSCQMLPLLLGQKFRLGERDVAETYPSNNCTVYAYEVEEILYHKKVMVIDDRISVVGSYNMGYKSHYGDFEAILEIDSPIVAHQVKQTMEQDKAIARQCDRSQLMDWYFGLASRSLALLGVTLIVGPLY